MGYIPSGLSQLQHMRNSPHINWKCYEIYSPTPHHPQSDREYMNNCIHWTELNINIHMLHYSLYIHAAHQSQRHGEDKDNCILTWFVIFRPCSSGHPDKKPDVRNENRPGVRNRKWWMFGMNFGVFFWHRKGLIHIAYFKSLSVLTSSCIII